MSGEVWTKDEFLKRLTDVGGQAYHHLHPFNIRMNEGSLDRESIQRWSVNRFYYQSCIPIKDAAILSNCPIREVRQKWLQRVINHDGTEGHEGGIEKWIRLAMACGFNREEIVDERHVLPAVRFAVDAYVNFARTKPWPIAVASSLTELFAPDLMAKRVTAFAKYYPWIAPDGLDYFHARLIQAKEDSDFALEVTLEYCNDRPAQEAAVHAIQFKCEVLWAMLDALSWKN
jgi:pyrroloquinoline-quinone synthase